MEIKKLIPGAALALMMTACSSDEPGINPDTKPVFEGEGYVSVSINLPTTKGAMSRALNDHFGDGDTNEYIVDNGLLLIFTGSDESDAVFQYAYDLGAIEDNYPNNEQVTNRFNKTIKVDNIEVKEGEQIFGLVMLNYDNVVTLTGRSIAFGGSVFQSGEKFTTLVNKIVETPFYNGEGTHFFMTNSPLVNVKGGSTAPTDYKMTTLVSMGTKLYDTPKEAAEATPQTEIYVERAVAKAELNINGVKIVLGNEGEEGYEQLDATFTWSLSNTQSSSYVVRNMGQYSDPLYIDPAEPSTDYLMYKSNILNDDNYRFVGHKSIDNYSLYRPYWCIDPNYSEALGGDKTYTEADIKYVGADKKLYCYENTFDVAHQNYKNTTRAVIKAVINGGVTFYTVKSDDSNTFYDELGKAQTFAEKLILEYAPLKAAIESVLEGTVENANVSDYVEIKWSDKKDGVYTVEAINFVNLTSKPTFDTTNLKQIANDQFAVSEYVNGECYYDVRFKHFAGTDNADGTYGDDDLAPWNRPNITTDDVYDSYGDDLNAQNFLGRYGMVRNNWYVLTVTAIKHLGSPVVPNANINKPDDNNEEEHWISFRVNVLSWAKRNQEVNF